MTRDRIGATSPKDEERGRKLLNAVERILADPEEIAAQANDVFRAAFEAHPHDPGAARAEAAEALIESYAKKTAVGGGLSAVPSVIPGIGSLASTLGGALFDMAFCIKYETELIMSLSTIYGHDIRTQDEREYCLLLAGLSTYREIVKNNATIELLRTGRDALRNYAPRQALAVVFVNLARLAATRGLLRMVPVAGVVAVYFLNRKLTTRVGQRAIEALDERIPIDGRESE